jgi:hypothetical protein
VQQKVDLFRFARRVVDGRVREPFSHIDPNIRGERVLPQPQKVRRCHAEVAAENRHRTGSARAAAAEFSQQPLGVVVCFEKAALAVTGGGGSSFS